MPIVDRSAGKAGPGLFNRNNNPNCELLYTIVLTEFNKFFNSIINNPEIIFLYNYIPSPKQMQEGLSDVLVVEGGGAAQGELVGGDEVASVATVVEI